MTGGADRTGRLLLYIHNRVHLECLAPVIDALPDELRERTTIGHPPPEPGRMGGLSPEDIETLRLSGLETTTVTGGGRFRVAVCADIIPYHLDDCPAIINIGHGLLSKGLYFTDSIRSARENLADILCVPGPHHRRRLENSRYVRIPVIETGFPKLDPLFRPDFPDREGWMRRMGLDPGKRVILYAPTFNPELSAIPVLGSDIARLADEDCYLVIKLHPAVGDDQRQLHRRLAENHPEIVYAGYGSLIPFMRMADVMVSDVSSAFMEFICIDKPVVLVNNPSLRSYPYYDPRDIEYAWRDVGIQCGNIREVREAVDRSLSNPDEYSTIRTRYAEQLLYARDGKASARLLEVVKTMMSGHAVTSFITGEKPAMVLLPALPGKTADLLVAIAETGPGANVAPGTGYPALPVAVGGGEQLDQLKSELAAGGNDYPDCGFLEWGEVDRPGPLEELFERVDPGYVVFLEPSIRRGPRWVRRLINHLCADPEIGIIFPLLHNGGEGQEPLRNVRLPDGLKEDPGGIDGFVRYAFAGLHSRPRGELSPMAWAIPCDAKASGLVRRMVALAMDRNYPESEIRKLEPRPAVARDVAMLREQRSHVFRLYSRS